MYLMPKTTVGTMVLGAAAAVVTPLILRPVLVGLVKIGYEAKDYAASAWESAKAEATDIRTEAIATSSPHVEAELRQLRDEVQTLRSQLATKRTAS